MVWFLCTWGFDGLLPTSGEDFMSFTHLIQKWVTCSILLCKYHQFALGANPHVFMLSVFFTLCSCWNHDTMFTFVLLSLFQDLIRDQGLPRSDGGEHPRGKLHTQLFPHHLTSLCSWIFFICVRVCAFSPVPCQSQSRELKVRGLRGWAVWVLLQARRLLTWN